MNLEVLFVGIGMEYVVVCDFGVVIIVKYRGCVEYVEFNEIFVCCLVEENGVEYEGELDRYLLVKFKCLNLGICYN